jgi:type I restriction enzyme ecoEI specificity protein
VGENMIEQKRLGDIATYINGFAFKPEDRGTVGLPIIRIQDLTGNAYDLGFYAGNYPERIEINDGDVLISWSASLGVYVWDKGKALLNQHIFKVVFDKCEVNREYFVYAVRYKLKEMESKTHGATMKHIVKKDFDNTLIPFPTLEEQENIANLLDKISTIILVRQQQLQKLDELVKARFVEMFGDDKYSKMPLINLITEGAGLSYGIVQPGDSGTGDMGVLRPVDMVNGEISTHSIKYIDRSIGASFKKTELVGDELLITVRGTTGVTALTDSRFKNMNVTRGIAVIRYDRRKINPIYLNAFLNTDESQQYIQEHTRGATLQQINLSDLRVHMIPVPPIELQEKLADFIQQVDKSKVAVQKSLDEAQLLFDSLMQQYFG